MTYSEDIEKKKLRIPMKRSEPFPQVREKCYDAISENEKSKRRNGHISVSSYEDIEKNKLRIPKKRPESFPQVREKCYDVISETDKSKRSNGKVFVSYDDTNMNSPALVLGSRKRRQPGFGCNQKEKRRKLRRNMSIQCSSILKQLRSHPYGWIFNQPVDPVKLNIPDYFSIVTKPMDLGTVLAKLEKHAYSSAEEFEADVRLTFSNAILYNPPDNQVHIAAKEINHMFDTRWRSLEAKWNQDEDQDLEHPSFVLKQCGKEMDANISRKNNNSSFTGKPATTKPLKMREDCRKQRERSIVHKASPCLENAKRSTKLVPVCASCRSVKCQCHLQNNGAHAFSSDLSSERSGGHDVGALRRDSKPKSMSVSENIKPVPDSDGDDASSLDMNSTEVVQLPVSPKKALRAAMLLARYSNLIVKTMHGDKADPVKIQKEKSKLERQQQIEKKKIEDEIRANKTKLEMQRKKEIESARQASRLALDKMNRVEPDDNLYNFKEFEKSFNCSLSDPWSGRKLLQSLGLFIKRD
ncbi:transcription factor GTE12 isoform X2 [Impatiens glandulifera]|uniref:transcription factor GTE12 isoform X2 n=1 Tax=Impatiens glandulifera TaxID=253017 RepID=UPI001FB05A0A|nr:transcription factor GTE12 isoform X2 [Impatiens glandulifera]